MTTKASMVIASMALVAGVLLLGVSGPTYAGGDKDLKGAAIKIAELLKKGDKEGAKALAEKTAKGIDDVGDIMHLFKPRNKGGLGVGSKAQTNMAKDGIEIMIRDYARDVPAKPVAGLEETGYWIAALAELSAAKGPGKDQGKKTKKNWSNWASDMKAAGLEFAKAGAGNAGAQIKAAATKVNGTCSNCHSVFKDN